jgi:hypothetical protein
MTSEELFGRLAAAQIEYWPGLGQFPLRVEQWRDRVLNPGRVCARVPYHDSLDRLPFALTILGAVASEPEDGRWQWRLRGDGVGLPPSAKQRGWWQTINPQG